METELVIHHDERGTLTEIFKLPGCGQVFYSTSSPGVVRGNHYHTRKIERFCVLEGTGRLRLRNRHSGEKREFWLCGEKPSLVNIPVGWTHNIENTGDEEMKLLVWSSEIFNPEDPDTWPEEV